MRSLLIACALLLPAAAFAQSADDDEQPESAMSLMVEFKSGTTDETIAEIHQSLGVQHVLTTENLNRGTRVDEVTSPYAAAVDDIARAYRANAHVILVHHSQKYAVPAQQDEAGDDASPENPDDAPVIDLPSTD